MDRQHNGQTKQERQTTNYKTLHRKLKIEQHEPHKNRGEPRCPGRVSLSCSTCGTHRLTRATHPVISQEWRMDRFIITCTFTDPAIVLSMSMSFILVLVCGLVERKWNGAGFLSFDYIFVLPLEIQLSIV